MFIRHDGTLSNIGDERPLSLARVLARYFEGSGNAGATRGTKPEPSISRGT